jgi:hypothetical protein
MMAEQPARGIDKYLDRDVYTADGKKLGTASKLVKNRVTDVAEWLVVGGGLLGRERYIVPLAGSDLAEDRVTIAYSSEQVASEPRAEPDNDTGALPPEAEDALNAHFDLGANGHN